MNIDIAYVYLLALLLLGVKCITTELCLLSMLVQSRVIIEKWTLYFLAGLVTLSIYCFLFYGLFSLVAHMPIYLFMYLFLLCSLCDPSSSLEGEILSVHQLTSLTAYGLQHHLKW